MLRSLQARLRDTYSVAISETGARDKWQRAELVAVYVSSDPRHVDEVLARVQDAVEGFHMPLEVLDFETELMYPF